MSLDCVLTLCCCDAAVSLVRVPSSDACHPLSRAFGSGIIEYGELAALMQPRGSDGDPSSEPTEPLSNRRSGGATKVGWSEKLTDRPVSHRTKGARDRYAQDEVERRTAQAAEQARSGMQKSTSLGEMRRHNGQHIAPSHGDGDGRVGVLHGGRSVLSSSLPLLPESETAISIPSFLMAGGDFERGEPSYLRGRRSATRSLKQSRQRMVLPPPPTLPITVEWPEGHARRVGSQQNLSNAQQQQQAAGAHESDVSPRRSPSESQMQHSHSLPVLIASKNARPPPRLVAPPVTRAHAKPIWADSAVSDAQWFKEWLRANDGVRVRTGD